MYRQQAHLTDTDTDTDTKLMPHLFPASNDDLLGPLPASFGPLAETLRELVALLAVDSYTDMGKATEAQRQQLKQLEATLAAELTPTLQTTTEKPLPHDWVATAPSSVREAWYSACLALPHYADTVGPPEEHLSTIASPSLQSFRPRTLEPAQHQKQLRQLAHRLQLAPATQAQLEQDLQAHLSRLKHARALIDALRQPLLRHNDDGTAELSPRACAQLFQQLFPDSPLYADEIDLILTRTGMYWVVAANEDLKRPERTDDEVAAAQQWLKQLRRFRYELFTHFPMFSVFDARDAEPELIHALTQALGWSQQAVLDQLSRSLMIESRPELEKYLIHDSWGHIWQGYLTDLTTHYDHLATKQFPLNADHHVTTPDGNVICLADCLYLHRNGSVDFNAELADSYIDALISQRMVALLTPICAELTADIIEYAHGYDFQQQPGRGVDQATGPLPSSSLFAHNPTKIDFAWADMQYFARSLARPIRHYRRNSSLREALVTRLSALLRLKYSRNAALHDQETMMMEVSQHVDRFLDQYERRQQGYLNVELRTASSGGIVTANTFTRLFLNLIQIQCTVNAIYREHLQKDADLMQLRMAVNLFIVTYFQKNPAEHFWSLDEVLARWSLPLLAATQSNAGSSPS
jgi:hypothetical protein